jgi:hypothetical protein
MPRNLIQNSCVTRLLAAARLVFVLALAVAAAQAGTVEVIFSAPGHEEAGVPLNAPVRLQFSAPLDGSTLKDQVAIGYSTEDSRERGEPEPPAVAFTVSYEGPDRAVIIRPTQPWERFREVRLTLGVGIRGAAGERLRPFSLRFTTGGS